MMRISRSLVLLAVIAPALATASPAAPRTLVDAQLAQPSDLVAVERLDGLRFARHVLPATGTTQALAQSKIVYLNRTGVTMTPGNDDARTNRSSIVNQPSTIPAWNTSAATWAATVTCMQEMFARWDVVVTDVDPGMAPHIEAVFGGSPQHAGMPSGVAGVSPFTYDCGVVENSVVFTFTNVLPNNAQEVCEVMAQEVAHSYGLDHEMLASDPMTYLNFNGKRSFKDQTVACGEYSNRACGIGGSTCRANQNSVQLLNQRLGIADVVAPELLVTSPADLAMVPAGFEVHATATDNIAVQHADLYIDDILAGTAVGPGPYTWLTDAALAEGPHGLRVEASDGRNTQTQTLTITVQAGGDGTGGGNGSGTGDGDGDDSATITGGCATGGHGGGLALGLLATCLVRRRRR